MADFEIDGEAWPAQIVSTRTKKEAEALPAQRYQKFSNFITSPIFSVVVGEKDSARTFLIHSQMLIKESDRLAIGVEKDFKEKEEKTITIKEEDPDLFGYFVEYLYCSKWSLDNSQSDIDKGFSKYVVLARLYTLGERLQALTFQSRVLQQFTAEFSRGLGLPDQAVCDLLEIVCLELPDKIEEDPLRAQVLWYGASRLTSLQKYPNFRTLLDTHDGLGRCICRWAGDCSYNQPQKPSNAKEHRFKPESVYE